MDEVKNRREALEEKIEDLEQTLAGLKAQLRAESEREQHEAIDRLEMYLGDLDKKNSNLQDFWKMLRSDIGELFGLSGDRGKNQ